MNNNNQSPPPIRPLRRFRYPLTPYQLFTPVSTVFLDNLTYEEQLLGVYKQYNGLVNKINETVLAINETQQIITELDQSIANFQNQINEIHEAINTLQSYMAAKFIELTSYVNQQDQLVFQNAKDYTDHAIEEFSKRTFYNPVTGRMEGIQKILVDTYEYDRTNAITAQNYDAQHLSAESYDNLYLNAGNYDRHARTRIMYSPEPEPVLMGTIALSKGFKQYFIPVPYPIYDSGQTNYIDGWIRLQIKLSSSGTLQPAEIRFATTTNEQSRWPTGNPGPLFGYWSKEIDPNNNTETQTSYMIPIHITPGSRYNENDMGNMGSNGFYIQTLINDNDSILNLNYSSALIYVNQTVLNNNIPTIN